MYIIIYILNIFPEKKRISKKTNKKRNKRKKSSLEKEYL